MKLHEPDIKSPAEGQEGCLNQSQECKHVKITKDSNSVQRELCKDFQEEVKNNEEKSKEQKKNFTQK